MTTQFITDLVLEAFCERTRTTKESGTIETYIAQFKGDGIKVRIESEEPLDTDLILGSDARLEIKQTQTKLETPERELELTDAKKSKKKKNGTD